MKANEVQGTPLQPGATAFADFQGTPPQSLRADGHVVKIVIRVGGAGPLRLRLTDPAGRPRQLAWGPDAHATSNYGRPGDEWGLGVSFNTDGCWRLLAERSGVPTAGYWLRVNPR